jgi:hypothetical protein
MKEQDNKISILYQWQLWLLAALTLGLAPFHPEPHIWGKLQWVLGGADGMKWLDWWDFIMHGTPWLLLLLSVGLNIRRKTLESGEVS